MTLRPAPALTERLHDSGPLTAVLAAAALAHFSSLFNDFAWDDLTFILGNPVLREAGNIPSLFWNPETWGTGHVNPYYRPLTMLSFLIDTLLWGARPAGFHATNLLLHLGVCALLLAALRRLLSPGAALAAARLFAVHPATAEPVAYVSARGDLVCGFFLLASFLAWLRHGEGGGRGALALSAIAYGAALLAKITAGPFPAVFALYALLFLRRRPHARDLLPFAAAALLYLAVRAAVLEMDIWPQQPLLHRVATAGPVIVRYALMAVSPGHLRVFHDLPLRTSLGPIEVEAWALIAAVVAIAAVLARRAPRAVFGLAWFLAGIVPASGLVTILYPALAADRYLYIPLLGGAVAAGAGFERLAALRLPATRRRLAAGLAAIAFVALTGFTMARGRLWRDSVTFWERAAFRSPDNQYVLNGLGWAYNLAGHADAAERALLRSLEINEASPQAHLNLASLALHEGDVDAARRHALRTLELDPGSASAYRLLCVALLRSGQRESALRAAEAAVALNPFDESLLELFAGLRRHDAGPVAPGY